MIKVTKDEYVEFLAVYSVLTDAIVKTNDPHIMINGLLYEINDGPCLNIFLHRMVRMIKDGWTIEHDFMCLELTAIECDNEEFIDSFNCCFKNDNKLFVERGK
jgi:hypothetical protein